MTRSLTALSLAALLALPFTAQAHLSDVELDAKIKAFILNNPSVVVKSLTAAEDRAKERESQKQRQMVLDMQKPLFDNPHSPSHGPKDADVTIVEFFDYNCGACKMMFRGLELKMLQDTKLRIVFKEYPIFGELSNKLASIGQAVHKIAPEKYYAFHTKMMRHQGRVDEAVAYGYVRDVGINVAKIKATAATPAIWAIVEETTALAGSLDIKGTPTLIIGDELVPHALDANGLNAKIDAYRSRQK